MKKFEIIGDAQNLSLKRELENIQVNQNNEIPVLIIEPDCGYKSQIALIDEDLFRSYLRTRLN